MKKFFFSIALAALLVGCGSSSTSTTRETVTSPSIDQFPLYPFWTIARMPSGPPQTSDPETISQLVRPTASAVLIAPGFLLTSTEGMGIVANSFGADATVFVFDGAAWHRGRYVDRDTVLDLALIRADVPGAPITLTQNAARPSAVLHFPLLGGSHFAGMRVREVTTPCEQEPGWMQARWGDGRKFLLCVSGGVNELSGGAMLDASGALAGLQVMGVNRSQRRGPDAVAIREYLTTYFASWGHIVRPRPKF